ncbi:MAG TPA: hypothetical protein VJG32_18220 [Anaerolineae bacterium]|nr:hypothetical protein [Anaerolineae bacterium]
MRQRIQWWVEQIGLLIVVAYFMVGDAPAFGSPEARLESIIAADRFDFIAWELEALGEKGAQASVPIQAYLDDTQRAQFVLDYLDRTRQLNRVDQEIDRIYSDPAIGDPESASLPRRADRDRLRSEVEQRRPTAEAIVQEQIASVLLEEGLATAGRIFPPVLARITPLPRMLILSPRDQIKRETGGSLSADLTVDRADTIEEEALTQLDKSALVTPIGGLALYPSMIIETPDLLFLLQVSAHEWVHHWLFLRPLGMDIMFAAQSGDVWTINETVASLVGDEIGIRTLKRFYPEIARRDYAFVYNPPSQLEDSGAAALPADPNAFNFNREMHQTRVQVDDYLAEAHALNTQADEAQQAGRVDEAESLRDEALAWIVKAEAYMEDRRKVFIENGYWIRKLNQAYFAFYGSYADQPGASGADPIGPAVRELRAKIPRVADFLNAVAPVTTLDELKQVLAQYP